MITKKLDATFEKIATLTAPATFRLHSGHFLLDGYEISVRKAKKGYNAEIDFVPFAGFNSSQLHQIDLPQPVRLSNSQGNYYVPEHTIHLHQTFTDLNSEELTIKIKGSISALNSSDLLHIGEKFIRQIVPVDELPRLGNIQAQYYKTDLEAKNRLLVTVSINGKSYHLFKFQIATDYFLGIDTTDVCSLTEFKHISYNILLAFGFLYGTVYLDEGFTLFSDAPDFSTITDFSFSTYRDSVIAGYRIHTTNAYSVLNLQGKDEQEIAEKHNEAHSWINDIIEIKEDVFSRLAELLSNQEPLSRAAMVILQGNTLSLEIKGSAYSLALEAITSVFLKEGGEKYPKPLEKSAFKALKRMLLEAIDHALPEIEENRSARVIFTNRINNLNSPTNTDKLKKAFDMVGYRLNEHELSALKARNRFQHGELPLTENTEDRIFQEIYFICIMMHRLVYVLMLKRIGFSGYIINYPQLHCNMTRIDLGEKLFYKL